MSNVKINIDEDKLKAAVAADVNEYLAKKAEKAKSFAQEIAPVDTGFYRDNITQERVDDFNYEVAANADYSIYVESRYWTMQKAEQFIRGDDE